MLELALPARQRRRGRVHLLAQFPRRHAPDELAGLLGEARGILVALAREADDARVAGETVEVAVRREIDGAGAAPRRDPADRPGDHHGLERVVRKEVAVALVGL